MTTKPTIISQPSVSKEIAKYTRLHPELSDTCELTVACMRGDYAASAIARAVEDCDAHLLNLDVTADADPAGRVIIELRVNHRDGQSVARSLERYGYTVLDVRGAGDDALLDSARDRVNALLRELYV